MLIRYYVYRFQSRKINPYYRLLSPRIGIVPAHYRTSPCSESFIGILWIRLAVLFVYGGELLTPRYSKLVAEAGFPPASVVNRFFN